MTTETDTPPELGPPGRWHLYGAAIEGAGYSMQVLFGNDDHEPFQLPTTHNVRETLGGGPPVDLPLLGSWDHRPTIAEKNAVLPEGIEPDEQAEDCDEYGDPLDADDDEDDDW